MVKTSGKALNEELHAQELNKMRELLANKKVGQTLKQANICEFMNLVNSDKPRYRVSDKEDETFIGDKFHIHTETTVYRSQIHAMHVSPTCEIALKKDFVRVQTTRKKIYDGWNKCEVNGEEKVTVSGNTQYRLWINGELREVIKCEAIPDSTIGQHNEGYTVNYHGEQQVMTLLEGYVKAAGISME